MYKLYNNIPTAAYYIILCGVIVILKPLPGLGFGSTPPVHKRLRVCASVPPAKKNALGRQNFIFC